MRCNVLIDNIFKHKGHLAIPTFKFPNIELEDLLVISFLAVILLIQSLIISYSPLNLAGDEAYYWLWSRHLDYCYYEKGPGIALLIALGCKIFGNTEMGVRSGAILCQFLISISLYFFIAKNYSRKIAKISLLLYWSTLLFGSLGLFMTCDPPLCLFWLLSILSASNAVKKNDSKYWIASFTFLGVAALFKYSAIILLPSYILFLLATTTHRKHLLQRGFIIGLIVLFGLLSPVIIWNMQHQWINLAKAYGHMGNPNIKFGLNHFFELIFGQWGLIGPILFPIFVYLSLKSFKLWRYGDALSGLYIFSALPLAALCLSISFKKSVYANWPMPIYLSLILLFAHFINYHKIIREDLINKSIKINFFILILAHFIFTGYTFGIPVKFLPSKKLITGRTLGNEVNNKINSNTFVLCENDSSPVNKTPFILSETYMDASLIAFYSSHPDQVYLADPNMPKLSQFDIWQNWQNLKGENALLVVSDDKKLSGFIPLFSKIVPLGDIDSKYNNEIVGKFYFFVACNFNGKNLSNFKVTITPPNPLN